MTLLLILFESSASGLMPDIYRVLKIDGTAFKVREKRLAFFFFFKPKGSKNDPFSSFYAFLFKVRL